MSPHPVIKVAPAQDTISVQTVEHEYQRTHDLKDYAFTISKPEELDPDDEVEKVTGRRF